MNLDEVFREAGNERLAKALKGVLEQFLTPAFGALPKSEVELNVLGALEGIGFLSAEPGVYELVSKLRVTRAKARKLIYERELRRTSVQELDSRVKDLLKRPLIQKSGDQFVLEIENPLTSDHLRAKVQSLGYIADGSFSPSIVRLPLDAIVALIEFYIPEAQRPSVKAALIAAGAPDTTFKGVLKAVLRKVARKVAEDTGEALLDRTSEYMSPIVDATVDGLIERMNPILQAETRNVG